MNWRSSTTRSDSVKNRWAKRQSSDRDEKHEDIENGVKNGKDKFAILEGAVCGGESAREGNGRNVEGNNQPYKNAQRLGEVKEIASKKPL
jgi:hypothetical protein